MIVKNVKSILLMSLLMVLFNLVACNEPDKLSFTGEEAVGTDITLGMMSAKGESVITIPLAALDLDEAKIDAITIDIYTNGLLGIADISAKQYYHASSKTIKFSLNGVKDGDKIEIKIDDGEAVPFEFTGSISASIEVVASESVPAP